MIKGLNDFLDYNLTGRDFQNIFYQHLQGD
jgi:hypothetical protein